MCESLTICTFVYLHPYHEDEYFLYLFLVFFYTSELLLVQNVNIRLDTTHKNKQFDSHTKTKMS